MQCLTDEQLGCYLAGELQSEAARTYTEHVNQCGHCSEHLSELMRLLGTELNARERDTIASIPQRTYWPPIAEQRVSRSFPARRQVLTALAAGIVLVVLTWALPKWWPGRSHSLRDPFELDRPFEARVSLQPYRNFTRTLAPIEDPDTTGSARERARALLAHRNFSDAINAYLPLVVEATADAAVHNDLGVAYLESGEAHLLPQALEQFRLALSIDAAFAPAAFNTALCYERMGDAAAANGHFTHYLQLDTTSGWAVEARARINGR